jgi:hypothetical protein
VKIANGRLVYFLLVQKVDVNKFCRLLKTNGFKMCPHILNSYHDFPENANKKKQIPTLQPDIYSG